ncbi:hypothetical protein MTO96_017762 [Rhipicephalus appendiculatus]
MPKLYAVVKFPEEQNKVVVPLTWLTEDRKYCFWPPKMRALRVHELTRDLVGPSADWGMYPVTVMARCRIRGLQALGFQLLQKKGDQDFVLRQKEIELQHRRLDHEERRMALEERKVALDEERLRMEAERQNATIETLNRMNNRLEELEKKILWLHK